MPAHTVIILGTKVYADSCWEDLSFADILQMAGRAGRPSFDTNGECFIIPSANDAYRCLTIFSNRFNIESSFLTSHTALEKLSKLIITEAFLSAHVFVDELVQIVQSSLFAVQLFERLPNSLNGSQIITDIVSTLLDCCCDVSLLEKSLTTHVLIYFNIILHPWHSCASNIMFRPLLSFDPMLFYRSPQSTLYSRLYC